MVLGLFSGNKGIRSGLPSGAHRKNESEKMKAMKFCAVLLALLLAGMAMVPIAGALEGSHSVIEFQTQIENFDFQSAINTNETKTITGLTLDTVKTSAFSIDPNEYDNPLSREEFIKNNQESIDLISQIYGKEAAEKMINDEFDRLVNGLKKYDEVLPKYVSPTIFQIWGYDIFLWPYHSKIRSTNDQDATPVNFIVLYKDRYQLEDFMISHGWHHGVGLDEWGLRGPFLDTLSWISVGPINHMEKGSYFGIRDHCLITHGTYSQSLQNYWCYGECHYEYWSGSTHYLFTNGFDLGRSHMYDTLSSAFSAYWISLGNYKEGLADGWGLVYL